MVIDRIGIFIREKGLSVASFEKYVGLSDALMAKALKNGTSIRSDSLEKILETFPELSAEWLFRGTGEMFLRNDGAVQGDKDNSTSMEVSVVKTAGAVIITDIHSIESIVQLAVDKAIEGIIKE